jgi:hypothetical protein
MAKAPIEIRSLARSHTDKAINTLVEIMENREVNESARVSAANSLLDRGWGKAPQAITGEDGGPLTLVLKQFTLGDS